MWLFGSGLQDRKTPPTIHRDLKFFFLVFQVLSEDSVGWKVHNWMVPQGMAFLTRMLPITWNFAEQKHYVYLQNGNMDVENMRMETL